MNGRKPPASRRIAVISGALGYAALLATFIRTAWPNARIEEVDPFSQTMHGLGINLSGDCDLMIVAGIGTEAEARSALQRLAAGRRGGETQSLPPVILLVDAAVLAKAGDLVSAGAAAVLPKDALSRRALIGAMEYAIARADHSAAAIPTLALDTAFGHFAFNADGETVRLLIEGYRPLAPLASNGLAQVFLAERIIDGVYAVVKIGTGTPHHELAAARRFCERFRCLFGLQGEKIVRYLDAGIAASWPYVVVEYLGQHNLRAQLKPALAPDRAIPLMQTIGESLRHLHQSGFAHMDLKPENIFFRDDGRAVLIDFNISTRFGAPAHDHGTGNVVGSPYYMSPEQGRGEAVDNRSDLYSLGVVFFEMLTGKYPYEGDNSVQVIYNHLHEEIPLLPKRLRVLQPVIDRLLAKNPEERFANVDALLTAFAELPTADLALLSSAH